MAYTRSNIQDFAVGNSLYVNGIVTYFKIDPLTGKRTNLLANLYAGMVGDTKAKNPQQLDSYGKFKNPVYLDEPAIAAITGLHNVPDHETGVDAFGDLIKQVSDLTAEAAGYAAAAEAAAETTIALPSQSLILSAGAGLQQARRLDFIIPSFHVEAFGAVTSTSNPTDAVKTANTAAFNAAAAAAKAFGGGFVVAGDSKISNTYYLNGQWLYDPSTVGFAGNGCKLDYSSLVDASAILFEHTSAIQFGHVQYCFRNAWIVGPGIATNTVGMDFNSNTTNKSSRVTVYDVYLQNFGINVDLRNRSYLLQFYNCIIKNATYNIRQLIGVADAGENISFHKCTISGGGFIYMGNPNGAMIFDTCSIDYNQQSGWLNCNAGHMFCVSCHFEDNIANGGLSISPFTVGANSGATITISGGDMLLGGSLPQALPSIVRVGAGGMFTCRDVFIHNMRTTADIFKDGAGKIRMYGTRGFSNNGGNAMLADITDIDTNLMSDGGFETAIRDLIWISDGPNTVTNRLDGVNIKLTLSNTAAHSGLQSLRAQKLNGNQASCGFNIAIPITPGCTPIGRLWYSNPDAVVGNTFINRIWTQVLGCDGNGIPIVGRQQVIGTLTSTSADTGWGAFSMRGDSSQEAPMWATHLLLNVNMTPMNNGFRYFDDIVVNLT